MAQAADALNLRSHSTEPSGLTEPDTTPSPPPPHPRAQPREGTQVTRKTTQTLDLWTGPRDDAARMSGQLSKPESETEGEDMGMHRSEPGDK